MSNYFLIAGSMYLGWVLSPEALVLASNYAGTGGMFAPIALLVALFILYFAIIITKHPSKTIEHSTNVRFVQTSTNLAATSALVIFLPTGMLVTAGFTFNETFLYWFPNFGFSAVLLSFILIIHLFGRKTVEICQTFFSSLTVISLLIIIAAGLINNSDLTQEPIHLIHTVSPAHTLTLLAGGLLFFLGSSQLQTKPLSFSQICLIITAGIIVLIFWQIVALKHLPQEKLATSTIPYIVIARTVLGQTGRILMGITIISGTCAATNYFMSLATEAGSSFVVNWSTLSQDKDYTLRRLFSLFFAIIIAICMASGLAGEPHLELYIYGTLLLWLLSSGIRIYTGIHQQRRDFSRVESLYYVIPTIFFLAFLYLIINHNEAVQLVIFISLALLFSSVFTMAVMFLGKKYHKQSFQQGDIR